MITTPDDHDVIRSASDLIDYIRADLARYHEHPAATLLRLPQARWQLRLRATEWWCNTRTGPVGRVVGMLLRARLQNRGMRLGYTIAINRVGAGLRLPHWGTIVLNGESHVGPQCQICHGVTLGGNEAGAPRVGDNVFFGPNVQVIGPVVVGARAVLLPGAIVVSDVPVGEIWGGVPARRVKDTVFASGITEGGDKP